MNTNSTPETQTAKDKDDMCIFGNYGEDDKYNLFTLPVGHVVYVIDKEDGNWTWFEEHIIMTEVQMDAVYSKMTIYTQEGNKYTWEVDAFMTVQGAMAAVEEREAFDMQQRDIKHMNKLIDEKDREINLLNFQIDLNKPKRYPDD